MSTRWAEFWQAQQYRQEAERAADRARHGWAGVDREAARTQAEEAAREAAMLAYGSKSKALQQTATRAVRAAQRARGL